ncbi:hypothetical protein [Aestuariibaculum sediminum]|uniref:Uncharacterized protein n=1 Tax=Aestuariibaculum sediminum TaxID=2770637 RepID=A0A8J6Q3J7_9FLAO|nr:hypothetical protein [Aestuariibaculum sediminum]MBD0833794.1 hypothetical protein [Aestuariibaculum sediminum]
MVVLRKIQASTLMETLVASVLLVVLFMITSLVLNNIFGNMVMSNTRLIDSHINELKYLYENEKITIPYREEFQSWEIEISLEILAGNELIILQASNKRLDKQILKSWNVH